MLQEMLPGETAVVVVLRSSFLGRPRPFFSTWPGHSLLTACCAIGSSLVSSGLYRFGVVECSVRGVETPENRQGSCPSSNQPQSSRLKLESALSELGEQPGHDSLDTHETCLLCQSFDSQSGLRPRRTLSRPLHAHSNTGTIPKTLKIWAAISTKAPKPCQAGGATQILQFR